MKIEEIRTVGVVGAGSMGAGIAQAAAQAGFEVRVVDVGDAAWDRARKTISRSLDRLAAKEKITQDQAKEALGRLRFSTDVASLNDVSFLFEAVFEDIDVKKELFAKLDAICGPEITVWRVRRVPATFDARFSAVARHYLYRIVNRRSRRRPGPVGSRRP